MPNKTAKPTKKKAPKPQRVDHFTIDRKKWLRGNLTANFPGVKDLQGSCLLDSKGRMCCLGFYLCAIGVDPVAMDDVSTPRNVMAVLPEEAQWLLLRGHDSSMVRDSLASDALVGENDAVGVKERAREKSVAELFAAQGIEVDFIG